MINPYQNREKSALAIKTAEKIARWTATITTGLGGGVWGYSIAMKYLPEAWGYSSAVAMLVGIAFSVMLGWLTDHAFGDILQRVVTDLVSASHPNATKWEGHVYFRRLRTAETVGFCIVLASLLAFDLYTTLVISDPVADQAKKLAITDIAAATATVSSEQKSAVAPMEAQLKTLKNDIAAAERNAVAGNPALAKLAAEGNGWAKSQLAAKKNAATKRSRAELEKLTSAYTASLSAQSDALSETQRLINAQNVEAAAANQRNRAVMAGMYTSMTVGPKILSIILRVLMVITFFAYSSSLQLDLNGDGVIDYADVEVYYANLVQKRQEREARARAARKTAPDFDDIGGQQAFK